MKDIEKMLNFGKDYKVDRYKEKIIDNKVYKVIYVSCKKTKDKCPECGKYTKSVHDKLKPIELKSLKIMEYSTKIIITKEGLFVIIAIKNLLNQLR